MALARRAAAAGVFVLLAAGCGESSTTFDDPRGTLEVKAGEPFAIELGENPSTGYEWRFTRRPDATVARIESGDDFELEEGGEDRDGAGGTRTFRFRAGRRGRGQAEAQHDDEGDPVTHQAGKANRCVSALTSTSTPTLVQPISRCGRSS